ncbi:hypothetical protein JCM5350_005047 [Sporobolomyces pararoseus]
MSNEKLTLWTSPSVFVNPQRIRLFAYEKGISDKLDEKILDMTPIGEKRSWRHLKVNPFGETPALKLEDGTIISESTPIARYLGNTYPGRKVMGETLLEQALDQQCDQRVWVHCTYRLTVAFHVLHQGLGHKLELVKNEEWGPTLSSRGNRNCCDHLSDGRKWILGGEEPTFADITLCVAIAFSKYHIVDTDLTERFEYIEYFWKRWQERDSFKKAYADGGSIDELKYLIKQ